MIMQEIENLSLAFAHAVVAENFVDAHALLSTELKASLLPSDLARHYHAMIAYGSGAPTDVELIRVETMEGWPMRQANDLGWAYVAISGEDYNEAVSVVVALEGERAVIRWLEWGRP